MLKNNHLDILYLTLLISIVVLVYLPGLPGGFIYDDYSNFLHNALINKSDLSFSSAWAASNSGISGPLGRPVPMFSFYINYQLGEYSPLGYKLFNFAIHLINTILVYLLVNKLLNIFLEKKDLPNIKDSHTLIAFWVTAIWAVHPINLTAVLYIVQRMTSMSTTFVLLGILSYIKLRTSINLTDRVLILKLINITFLGIVAALCKENGLLLFLFLFLLEIILFKWNSTPVKHSVFLKYYYVIVLLIPFFIVLYFLFEGELTTGYRGRDFDMMQRLMTELRVIWFYTFLILVPRLNAFNLFHDDFIVSTSMMEPFTTLLSLTAFLLLFIIVLKSSKKWLVLGVLFFFSGHLMESTVLPLNLVHEHRNYLPSVGLIFVFVISVFFLAKKTKLSANILLCIITLLFSILTMSRAHDWSNPILLSESLVQKKPTSLTANYLMGETYSKLYQTTSDPIYASIAKEALSRADILSDSNVQPAIALLHVNAMQGEKTNEILLNKIVDKFSKPKVIYSEINSFVQLINCVIEQQCSFPENIIMKLYLSLLDNDTLSPNLRDDVLLSNANYLSAMSNNLSAPISIMNELVVRNPERLDLKVKYISLLLSNGEKEKAELLMEEVSRKNGIKWNVVPE